MDPFCDLQARGEDFSLSRRESQNGRRCVVAEEEEDGAKKLRGSSVETKAFETRAGERKMAVAASGTVDEESKEQRGGVWLRVPIATWPTEKKVVVKTAAS